MYYLRLLGGRNFPLKTLIRPSHLGYKTVALVPEESQRGEDMRVEWQDDLCIGVLEVDIQHKLLFEKFNGFLSAYEANGNSDEVLRLFWFLEAYAITHFKDEEKLMQQVFFPDFMAHRGKHRAFIDGINDLKERLKVEGLSQSLVSTITGFITSWLIEHISTMDRAIGAFVNAPKDQL